MPLKPGDRFGPYEILSPIGAGGMGAVWKARDNRLNRFVAIKLAHQALSDRFEREGRAVAALNHPNICQLYDVGALPSGETYLVMEYIEGTQLAPVDNPRKLLELGTQIADGMAAAHEAGFVHRDLKPDNILVTREGRVKILDFGLVKSLKAAAAEAGETQTKVLTGEGAVLGTPRYMAPEQARGQTSDSRGDQFSIGLILYEMATGKQPFHRGSQAETLTAIIREDAEPLPATVPTPVRWIIERCLAKDPAERYHSTRDLHLELRHAREHLTDSNAIPGARAARARARWLFPLTAFVSVAVLALELYLTLQSPPTARAVSIHF